MITDKEKEILEKTNFLEILQSCKNLIKEWVLTIKNELILTFIKLNNIILSNILREFKNDFEIIGKNIIKFKPLKTKKKLKVNQIFKIK